ncbi:SEC14 domain and spectrin repeat-containing protein 1 [Schistocerca americana]|uniref:SEC14 domain and spectrin repeat-containing protein 1 n=1 Tax=Schistocerca americana TaxID=7009 RepID=UPI001F4F11FD|nr:SEC14 domain and spectrin repeat-containing protein 1 [Schistocerca americana]
MDLEADVDEYFRQRQRADCECRCTHCEALVAVLAGADLAQRWEQSGLEAPDTADARARLLQQLEGLRARRGRLEDAWLALEASELERGVSRVTAWILGPAEARLNAHEASGVGAAAAHTDRLRRDHEALELLCRETYGLYAELLHRIDSLPRCPDDLRAQRRFMDFACRSFASRLERRRNVLITAQRFSRLAGEYLERSDELLISLERNDTELERRLEQAEEALRQLHEDSEALGEVERECVREGERLSDLLVMPVKDALGRHLAVERAADTAAAWLRQLGAAMRDQVGCSVAEIQRQKEQHQDFQHTAKGSYEYGRQLVQAALALRQCCRLATAPNEQLSAALDAAWRRLDAAAQEHVTRLRVSAVFHRSVDQRLLAAREKLLLEVGRMVRLGRLLRTRLREPLAASDSCGYREPRNAGPRTSKSAAATQQRRLAGWPAGGAEPAQPPHYRVLYCTVLYSGAQAG